MGAACVRPGDFAVDNDPAVSEECTVCFVKGPLSYVAARCGHVRFCGDCARLWAAVAAGKGVDPSCPTPSCTAPYDEDVIAALLNDEARVARNGRRARALFLQELVRCPNAACTGEGIRAPADAAPGECGPGTVLSRRLLCPQCSRHFCAVCAVSWRFTASHECPDVALKRAEDHSKAKGIRARKQREALRVAAKAAAKVAKERDLAERAFWRREETGYCKRCHARIVKIGGCTNMSCPRCDYEFCWGCGQRSHSHRLHCSRATRWRQRPPTGAPPVVRPINSPLPTT